MSTSIGSGQLGGVSKIIAAILEGTAVKKTFKARVTLI